MNQHGKSPDSKAKAQEGRDLPNEGRVEGGNAPKTTKPGTGHPVTALRPSWKTHRHGNDTQCRP
jgi:hypothetical protein